MNITFRPRERDMDFFLIEELVSSPDFSCWFLSHIGMPPDSVVREVRHSHHTDTGETDISIEIETLVHERIMILIENKINAEEQEKQFERYRQRVEQYRKKYSHAISVLVAPREYRFSDKSFDHFDKRLSYEDLLAWLKSSIHLGRRLVYKQKLLEEAMNVFSTGYIPIPHEETGRFWHRYWELAESDANALNMKEPKIKPAKSSFIRFTPPELKRYRGFKFALRHKFTKGYVDLEFSSAKHLYSEFKHHFSGKLDGGMRLVVVSERENDVPAIRISVPKMTSDNFDLNKAREGLKAASGLLRWFEAHDEEINRFIGICLNKNGEGC